MSSNARVMVHDVDEHSHIVLCRHYNGSGVFVPYVEVYVIRDNKFLGRFSKELVWDLSSEHKRPPTEADIKTFSNHAKVMVAMAEKLWK